MSKLKYLIDGKADEQFENMLWCFGGGGGNDDDSGSDSGSTGGSGDSAFYDNERPGLTSQNRPIGGTTNVVQGTSQPREDRDPVMDIVTMGRPMTEAPAVLDTPLKRDIAESMFQDFANNLPPSPVAVSPNIVMAMDDPAGDYMLLGDAPNLVMDMDDPAGDYMLLQRGPADISVGSSNMPPAVITDVNGQAFNTTTGELITDGDPFDVPQSNMVPLDSAPVPTPPPPRYQTNAQKDFYENLAAQGDAAMNQFRAEVRNLDNRGLLGSAIASGIGKDGVPNFDASFPAGSQIRGVTTTNFVDLPVVGTVPISTYTGLDNPNAPADTSSDDNDVVPPVANPMTGTSQCPDGYTFDEDLQACRRMTKRELRADGGTDADSSTASNDLYFRRTSLDDAPANIPGGFNFADANRSFTQSYAFRPSFYRSPMDTTGFTKLL